MHQSVGMLVFHCWVRILERDKQTNKQKNKQTNKPNKPKKQTNKQRKKERNKVDMPEPTTRYSLRWAQESANW